MLGPLSVEAEDLLIKEKEEIMNFTTFVPWRKVWGEIDNALALAGRHLDVAVYAWTI